MVKAYIPTNRTRENILSIPDEPDVTILLEVVAILQKEESM
jgi:hypothetical protein